MKRTMAGSLLCAWIMWTMPDSGMPVPVDSYEKLAPCDSEAMVKSRVHKVRHVCLPDTFDPRPRK
jgi:hypothetical protein